MLNVKIIYKSGKIEITKIKINEYSEALKQLVAEKRLVSIDVVGVE